MNTGCFENNNNNDDNNNGSQSNEEKYHMYIVEIIPSNSLEFFIWIPFVIINNSIPIDIQKDVKFEEERGNYSLIKTEYGWALNVSSNEKIYLYMYIAIENMNNASLSMSVQSKNEFNQYRFYCQKDNSTELISINIEYWHPLNNHTDLKTEINDDIKNNKWNILDSQEEDITVDF